MRQNSHARHCGALNAQQPQLTGPKDHQVHLRRANAVHKGLVIVGVREKHQPASGRCKT